MKIIKIAIHAADLDHDRIDGTRVYLFNMLKNFGVLDKNDSFLIYHQSKFNPHLTPPSFPNYSIKNIPFPILWTQTRFALELFNDSPDVLWMPVHNVPLIRTKNMKVVVTIHDLAFKIFPEYFTRKDLAKLNSLSDMAVRNADRIIAVSHSTKKDLLRFYPELNEEKIAVIHHGFDVELFSQKVEPKLSDEILKWYSLKAKSYLLYVGAIQPRKNLEVLVEAFEKVKEKYSDLKLVIAGSPAWKCNGTLEKIASSKFKNDIIITGTLEFKKVAALYQSAKMFIFPSLYEGFGIPILEAMAAGTPVICAKNSSLVEAGGEAALYFETGNGDSLAALINSLMEDSGLENEMIEKGTQHIKNFSWEKCAKQTLDMISKK